MNKRSKSLPKKTKIPLSELISQKFDIPADILAGGLCIELRGRSNLLVSGCKRILSYSCDKIELLTSNRYKNERQKNCVRKQILCITGNRLSFTAYFNGQIGIDGEIIGITFCTDDCKMDF